VAADVLAQVTTVMTGSTPAAYHNRFDFAALDRDLRGAGFVPSWQRRLSPFNEIVVWRRAN
jgi:hypothetical protein